MPAIRARSLEGQLDEQVDAMDRLLGEVRGGIRSQAHFDELEEAADRIGKALRAAFRSPARVTPRKCR